MSASYYQQHKERLKKVNLERYHTHGKTQRLQRTYGITLEQAQDIWKYQLGQCICCKSDIPKPGESRKVHVDHNHETGKVRGILCHHCNLTIGHAKENPDTLKNIIRYLNIHQ